MAKQKLIPPSGSISAVDASYLAGLIDGEGCIGIYALKPWGKRKSYYHQVKVVVSMVDPQGVEFLAAIAHAHGARKQHRLVRGSVVYECVLYGKRAAAFLIEILPYLKVKRVQAELAIEFYQECHFNSSNQEVSFEMHTKREDYRQRLHDLKKRAAA